VRNTLCDSTPLTSLLHRNREVTDDTGSGYLVSGCHKVLSEAQLYHQHGTADQLITVEHPTSCYSSGQKNMRATALHERGSVVARSQT
jgi:hypothetical protein